MISEEKLYESALKSAEWHLANQVMDRQDANRGRFIRSYDKASGRLFRATNDKKYLKAIDAFGLSDWDLDITIAPEDTAEFKDRHAYAFFARCIALLELYEITKDKSLLSQVDRVLEFLINKGGLFITGSCVSTCLWISKKPSESWGTPQSTTSNKACKTP